MAAWAIVRVGAGGKAGVGSAMSSWLVWDGSAGSGAWTGGAGSAGVSGPACTGSAVGLGAWGGWAGEVEH